MLKFPEKLFITNWKFKEVVFHLVFVSFDLKICKEKWGSMCSFKFCGPPKNAHFLKIMIMRCFHIFNSFDHKDKLIIILSNLTLLDGV